MNDFVDRSLDNSPLSCAKPEDVCGWLNKSTRGGLYRLKQRFCILVDRSSHFNGAGALEYYREPCDAVPLGRVSLAGATFIAGYDEYAENAAARSDGNMLCTLALMTTEKTYWLHHAELRTIQFWMQELTRVRDASRPFLMAVEANDAASLVPRNEADVGWHNVLALPYTHLCDISLKNFGSELCSLWRRKCAESNGPLKGMILPTGQQGGQSENFSSATATNEAMESSKRDDTSSVSVKSAQPFSFSKLFSFEKNKKKDKDKGKDKEKGKDKDKEKNKEKDKERDSDKDKTVVEPVVLPVDFWDEFQRLQSENEGLMVMIAQLEQSRRQMAVDFDKNSAEFSLQTELDALRDTVISKDEQLVAKQFELEELREKSGFMELKNEVEDAEAQRDHFRGINRMLCDELKRLHAYIHRLESRLADAEQRLASSSSPRGSINAEQLDLLNEETSSYDISLRNVAASAASVELSICYDQYGFQLNSSDLLDGRLRVDEFVREWLNSGIEPSAAETFLRAPSKSSYIMNRHLSIEAQWDNYLRALQGQPLNAKDHQLKSLLRKGLPCHLRSQVWRSLIQMHMTAELLPIEKYHNSLAAALAERSEALDDSQHPQREFYRQIEKDLLRTMPENRHFRDAQSDMVCALRNVLCVFAWTTGHSALIHQSETSNVSDKLASSDPTSASFASSSNQIGYCQGLNRIAAILLLVLHNEEEAFCGLCIIVRKLRPKGFYDASMLDAQTDMNVLRDLVKRYMPDALIGMQNADLSPDILLMPVLEWLVTLFVANGFDLEITLRIWDAFWFEGDKVLFRFALSVIRYVKPLLLFIAAEGGMRALQLVQLAGYLIRDSERLVRMAFEGLPYFSHRRLEASRKQQREQVLEQRDQLCQIGEETRMFVRLVSTTATDAKEDVVG